MTDSKKEGKGQNRNIRYSTFHFKSGMGDINLDSFTLLVE